MRKFLLLALCFFILSGCVTSQSNDNNQQEPVDDRQVLNYSVSGSSYRVFLPFNQSDLRLYHGSSNTRQDRVELSHRLQQMATQHFDPKDYYIGEGVVINAQLHNRLIKFASLFDEGLNPEEEQTFTTTNNQSVDRMVIVHNVVELDYYKSAASDASVEGIAIALTLNKQKEMPDGEMVEISEETMIEWGESAARKLVSIIRSQPGMTNVPIFIGLYSLESKDSSLPGGYVSSALFEGRSGQFKRIKQEWLLLPSTQAASQINQLSVEFDLFKRGIDQLVTSEATGVIGEVRLVDNEANRLKIEINTSGKTYLEIMTISQFAASQLSLFDAFNLEITIQVKVHNDVLAVVSLPQDSDEPTIVYF